MLVPGDLEDSYNMVSSIGLLDWRHIDPGVTKKGWITVTVKVKLVIRLIVPLNLGMKW